MNHQAERRIGTIIGGKWRVDALLGSGSMAAVYGVTHRNGARAALKILHPTLCTDPQVCERFLGEGYLANSVKHNGIVRVLDDGVTDDGCVFLVMDLLEGMTLEDLRNQRGGRIPLEESLAIADSLMDVLSAVHAAGIIHRDLKPQNVFVCNDGQVKLLDFGVARVFDRGSASKLSMFGLVLGTPSFMSPEQALGSRDKVDHRSDIWSLGSTLFTVLTGETVHLGANMQAKLLAAATVKARSITMVMPDLPAPIAAAIDMSLRFKKEDRWQSVDAMRRAFRDARIQLGMRGLEPKAASAIEPPPAVPVTEQSAVEEPTWGSQTIKTGAPSDMDVAPVSDTLIGIGVADELKQKLASTKPPSPAPDPPKRAPSSAPPPAFVSRPPEPSIPALAPALAEPRKSGQKNAMGLWLGVIVLAVMAAFGVAFFAVSRTPAPAPDPNVPGTRVEPVQPPAPTITALPTTTASPLTTLPTTTGASTAVLELPSAEPDAGTTVAVKPPPSLPRRPRTPRTAAPPPSDKPPPDPTLTAAPWQDPAPKPATSGSDPFGTPE